MLEQVLSSYSEFLSQPSTKSCMLLAESVLKVAWFVLLFFDYFGLLLFGLDWFGFVLLIWFYFV